MIHYGNSRTHDIAFANNLVSFFFINIGKKKLLEEKKMFYVGCTSKPSKQVKISE